MIAPPPYCLESNAYNSEIQPKCAFLLNIIAQLKMFRLPVIAIHEGDVYSFFMFYKVYNNPSYKVHLKCTLQCPLILTTYFVIVDILL